MIPLKSKVAENYAEFLKSIHGIVIGTEFEWISPIPKQGATAFVSQHQIHEAIQILERYHQENPIIFTVIGKLTGVFLNPKSKKFEIETAEQRYTGKITDNAYKSVSNATMSQIYTAEIQEITKRNETTGELTNPKYLLLSLK